MLKKPNLLCSCGGFQRLSHCAGPSSISPHFPGRQWKRESFQPQCKRFAHVHSSHPLRPDDDLTWPSHTNFSPYDLFKQDRNTPYSKRRFYELAKIYHPDCPCKDHPQCKHLDDQARLHRYRLLVAAHEILSDPGRREAYDKFGEGWIHRAELFERRRPAGPAEAGEDGWWQDPTLRPKHTRTRDYVDPIFKNATWEDWEAWRQRENGQEPQATTVSHDRFASFVFLVVLFVGSAQVVTITSWGSHVEDRVKEVHQQCSKFLEGRRQHTLSDLDSGDKRIQSFLIKRDPSGHGLKGEEEEDYRRVLHTQRTAAVADDIDRLGKEAHVPNDGNGGPTGL